MAKGEIADLPKSMNMVAEMTMSMKGDAGAFHTFYVVALLSSAF